MGRGEHLRRKQPMQRPRGERGLVSQEVLNEELSISRGVCVYIRLGGSYRSELPG